MDGNGFLNERKFSIKISLANMQKHVISKYTGHGAFMFLHCANLMEYQISDVKWVILYFTYAIYLLIL